MKKLILNALNDGPLMELELYSIVYDFYIKMRLKTDVNIFIDKLEELKRENKVQIDYFDRNIISKI